MNRATAQARKDVLAMARSKKKYPEFETRREIMAMLFTENRVTTLDQAYKLAGKLLEAAP